MDYFTDVFSPETYMAFRKSDETETGLRLGRYPKGLLRRIEQVRPDDLLLCYMTGLKRWCGVLEVESTAPRFDENLRPGYSEVFPVRFKVKPIVLLEPESAVPIYDPDVWDALTFTKQLPRRSSRWTWVVRSTLRKIEAEDGKRLVDLLKQQKENPREYPLTDKDRLLLRKQGWHAG